MTISDALWDVFRSTGHIGAYLLYRQYLTSDEGASGENSSEAKLDDSRGVAGI